MPPTLTKAPTPPVAQTSTRKLNLIPVKKYKGNRIVIYGPGGVGKSTLAASLPGKTAYFDKEFSLGKISISSSQVMSLESNGWKETRDTLQCDFGDINNIVIDSGSKLEEECLTWMFGNIKGEKGVKIDRLEDYGYKAGYRHLFETFLPLLSDLEAHYRAGRNVLIICHEAVINMINPAGANYIKWEPRMLESKDMSLRAKLKEWSDMTLFLNFDTNVTKGKVAGAGTRTLYPNGDAWMAKSRTYQEPMQVKFNPDNPDENNFAEIWGNFLK